MRIICIIILLSLPVFVSSQDDQINQTVELISQNDEWVLVFDDPRPERLRGWVKGNYGRSTGDYQGSLELERFGKKVVSEYDLELRDQWFIPSLGVYCLVVRFNRDQIETISKLKQNKEIQWVQPSNEFNLLKEHLQPKLQNPEKGNTILDTTLPARIDGKGVVIAIIDSAVDDSHQDLVGAINQIGDFVVSGVQSSTGESHGTAIAGVMSTQRDTQLGVAGIAAGATVEAYRGCWESLDLTKTNCNTLSLARALDAVARGKADILNLSLSGPRDLLLDQILQKIIDRGTMVVAAFDPSRVGSVRFPVARDGVLIVRAQGLDSDDSRVFTAPGARVVARPGNRYDYMRGHSVATAYTSGLLALRKQVLSSKGSVSYMGENDWRNMSRSYAAEDLLNEILQHP